MSINKDPAAARKALEQANPAAREAFQKAGDLLARHLSSLGYAEHPELLLEGTTFEPFLGRCFFSKNRIVCLTLRAPNDTLELWVSRPYDPADVERSLLLHFPSGFRDYQYLRVEEEANPELVRGVTRDDSNDPASFPQYLERLLATPHLALILRGEFFHGYSWDARELYMGDYTMQDVANALKKSLREQGFAEEGQ